MNSAIKQLLKYPIIILFAVFILFFAIGDIITADRLFSPSENRNLQQRPEFSWEALMDGEFTSDYETYINDQFIFRDSWIQIKSLSETAIGKIENNGIIFGTNGYCFLKRNNEDMEQAQSNSNAIATFLANYENAYFAPIPSASNIISAYLPQGSPVSDERYLQETLFSSFDEESFINLFPCLEAHTEEYIYYRNDHHWTTLGAYYAYEEICAKLGLTPVDLSDISSFTIEDFYGSHYRSAKRKNAIADTITLYDMPITEISIPGKNATGLYDMAQFEKEDKYAGILYDNNGLTVITSAPDENKKGSLLLIKDSFGNSIAPYFTANYESVTLIDLRYFNAPISYWLKENSYDDILVLYNYDSIQDERALYKLGQ